ncbi:MAG: hypothetical protein IJH13_03145 [Bacilli bacterium]|nr:hypothetical protein [Bacilli bacterium]
MKKSDIRALIIIGIILVIICVVAYVLNIKENQIFTKTKMKDIEFQNMEILTELTKNEKEHFKVKILNYLNKKHYSYYTKVIFKEVETEEEKTYIYFYLNNDFKTLFECLYNSGNPKIYYLGDELVPHYESKNTSKMYMAIMNPEEYKEYIAQEKINEEENKQLEENNADVEKDLEETRKEAEKLPPDDDNPWS